MWKRYFSQMWTYGIGHDDLTSRERKMWVGFLYLLMGTATYYQWKDLARTSVEGPFSWSDYFKDSKTDSVLPEGFRLYSTVDLVMGLHESRRKNDTEAIEAIIQVLNERGVEPEGTFLTTEEISDHLSDADDIDVRIMRDLWISTDPGTLNPTERIIYNVVLAEYDKRLAKM